MHVSEAAARCCIWSKLTGKSTVLIWQKASFWVIEYNIINSVFLLCVSSLLCVRTSTQTGRLRNSGWLMTVWYEKQSLRQRFVISLPLWVCVSNCVGFSALLYMCRVHKRGFGVNHITYSICCIQLLFRSFLKLAIFVANSKLLKWFYFP